MGKKHHEPEHWWQTATDRGAEGTSKLVIEAVRAIGATEDAPLDVRP